jgi:hypothetical protein
MKLRDYERSMLDPASNVVDALQAVSGQTPPEKVAQLISETVATRCARPGASSPSFFFLDRSHHPIVRLVGAPSIHDYTLQWILGEYRGAFTFKSGPISEADRLNDVQWRGSLEFSATVYREFKFNDDGRLAHSPWTEWSNVDRNKSSKVFMLLRKQNSQWIVTSRRSPLYLGGGMVPFSEFSDDFAKQAVEGGVGDADGYPNITPHKVSCAAALADDPFSKFP